MINRNQIDIIKKAHPLYVSLTKEIKSFVRDFKENSKPSCTIHEIIIPAVSLMLGDMISGTTANATQGDIVLREIIDKTREIISRMNRS